MQDRTRRAKSTARLFSISVIAIASPAWCRDGQTIRCSVDSTGAQATGSSIAPAVSADGRFVAFESNATNLVPDDTNGMSDVFVQDVWTGETTRASVAPNGAESDRGGYSPAISGDGRYVAFQSFATNLVPGAVNGSLQIYVKDRTSGAVARASVDSAGTPANAHCMDPGLSADGRFVTFQTLANNLVPGDTNSHWDVFVHDLRTGITARASVGSGGVESTEGGTHGRVSADGRYVVFECIGDDLVPGDTNNVQDIFVHDLLLDLTARVSLNSVGAEASDWCRNGSISADGTVVVFESFASLLVLHDTNQTWDVFARDLTTNETRAVSLRHGGDGQTANGASGTPSISPDGRYVAFQSEATDLTGDGDSNGAPDVFVHDRSTGETVRASVDTCGGQASGASTLAAAANGGIVAFESRANDLVLDDTSPGFDVFAHRPSSGTPFCFGDGSGALCACFDPGPPGAGCPNSTGSGARLATTGSACLGLDDLRFEASEIPPHQPALILAGLHPLNGGRGLHFGDGLRCVGGAIRRLGLATSGPTGAVSYGPGLAPSAGWAPGDSRRFQVWYRDPLSPCGSGFNTTNAIAVVFAP